MKTHFMIDIETFGLTLSAVVVSIGAVCFDDGVILHNHFLDAPCVAQQLIDGRATGEKTLAWWHEQGLTEPRQTDFVRQMLIKFNQWFIEHELDIKNRIIWANGTDFDISILSDLHRQYGFDLPWLFYNVRDFRTMKSVFSDVPKPDNDNPHDALSDAINQAKHLVAINSAHKLGLFDEVVA